MQLTRSALFVPGHKPDWVPKAVASGADALILDLEDAVPDRDKIGARAPVKQSVVLLKKQGKRCSVRVNGLATGLTRDDLEAIFCPELEAVVLPKIETVRDMENFDALLTEMEKRHGLEVGGVKTSLSLETAKAMRNAHDMAVSCARVTGVSLAAGPRGDANRSLGYVWSKEGIETLYVRSKAVLDARAAGIAYPMVSSWWDVRDLEGLRRDARFNRSLGFRGQVVIHPSHVPIINEVFSPSADEIAYNQGLIRAFEEAERNGSAAVVYESDMIDYAMVKTAREMLEFAASIGVET
ncbi:CoA ester lyase [Candidatus Sumerlaeota bacterium]|nr:CoA ester lyase [Candidatus Sumerlaeota bacterium]